MCPYGTVHITLVQSSGRESPLEPAALVLPLLNWCEWKSSFDFGASGNYHLILDIGGLRSASQIYQRDFRFFVASVSGSTGATLRVLGFFGIGFRVMGLGGWG